MRQRQALTIMMSGASVFLTGAPGAGKTYVLNEFIRLSQRTGHKVAVTASTGIAATHIGGTTLHSWSGLGIRDYLTAHDLHKLATTDKLVKRYNAVDTLIIDEVSMLHGSRLDMVNQVAKLLRGNDAPFGGLQVILVGDLYQLPPVSRGSDSFDFVHLSAAWDELSPIICYLTEQHRQRGDDGLLDLLEAMRYGRLEARHRELLRPRLGLKPPSDAVVTRLYSHNIDVDAINQRHLAELPGAAHEFHMQVKGSRNRAEQLVKGLLAPEMLELKIGAEVMFVANNFAAGYVNGSLGKVVDFVAGLPLVELLNGRTVRVEPFSWSLAEDGRVRAEVSQLPLRLAWAITIHKSQGMSLDAAEIDLSRAFAPGMGYVALSRLRGLDGLYLLGLNAMAMQLHPGVHDFDAASRLRSAELAETTSDFSEADLPEPAAEVPADPLLLDSLKAWRAEQARAENKPAYMIAHNTALEALAKARPASLQQLLGVPGFGKQKVDKYGGAILDVLSAYARAA